MVGETMPELRRIVPCLWFDHQAEEAVEFYVSIFERSRITRVTHYGSEGQGIVGQRPGTAMTVSFELLGESFTALNGGLHFSFSEALSLQVMCDTQDEIDRYWSKLSAGGDNMAQRCGWLKDRYGLSWQIVPAVLPELVSDLDPARAGRVMKAVLGMKKLEIAGLEEAYGG
jgi:predicted 3-demethylubiquinone-9 3-methyltransferase (glyoxalase superfamily)